MIIFLFNIKKINNGKIKFFLFIFDKFFAGYLKTGLSHKQEGDNKNTFFIYFLFIYLIQKKIFFNIIYTLHLNYYFTIFKLYLFKDV